MPEVYFDERIANGYDTLWANLFDPAVVDPAVNFLAELAGTGAALELAGMTLRERWSDWNREPFTSGSRSHVSIWEKAA